MSPARPRRSLFWTIAGVFLLTVVVGSLAQWLVAVAVLRPLEDRDATARAELVATAVSAEIAAVSVPLDVPAIETILTRHREELGTRPAWIVYRASDGTIVTAPPWRAGQIAAALFGEPPPEPPPGEPQAGEPAPREERPPAFRFRPETLAKHAVARGPEALGEVFVIRPSRPPGGPGFLAARTQLLFLPIALLASALAGVIMLRILVRRLRALGTLAARVAEGDLTVRIEDRSGDEIGKLGERFNRMTERLAEARVNIEVADNQRRQLFADITHELATPLTSIRGYAETLVNPGVSLSQDERTRYIQGVLEEARRLDRLITDLFELARLEAGASPLTLEPIDWAALCRNTLERYEPRFRDAGLALRWAPSLESAMIEADGRRMEQVLENLLVNALRYVPTGGNVEASLERSPGRPGWLRLTVNDDGPGLPAEERSRVFQRFYRAAGVRETADGRDEVGSGLGLAIVREIMERHGGTVRAEERSPRGLSIVLELPAK